MSFVLVTDSSSDLPPEYYKKHSIDYVQLSFTIEDKSYTDHTMSPKELYDNLRRGKTATTTQVNVDTMITFMSKYLKDGIDVLYLAFSSGLSGTYSSGMTAAKELAPEYPERKIVVIDTLAASLGQGLLVHLAREMRDEGKSLDEIAAWVEENKNNMAHYVTVDNLMHLHRGGRISALSAVAGTVMGIKPLIFVNNEGKLDVVGKTRGRKQALDKIVDMLAEAVEDSQSHVFAVSHGDCEEDAQYAASLIKKRFNIKENIIYYVGPVIGSHTGPGVVAIFMLGKHK